MSGIGNIPGFSAGSGTQVASLNGQIRQVKQQLDDWTTCVSAKTTKGQAEIQRLSGQLSADVQRAHRLASLQSNPASTVQPGSIDVWA